KGAGRNYVHMISPILDEVCHNSKMLDAVESIIGKNILICGTTLFIKNPHEKGFVSFHQDATYIGLEPHNWVTAWLAITDANEENGCMRMWSGSHKDNIKHHEQKYDEGNLLTRGQTVENVPLDETIPLILKAGQMSLHHPTIVHGSGLNKTNDRRIGFVVQSYIGSNVDQVLGKMYVQQARGDDTFKYHQHTKRPSSLMNSKDIEIRKKANNDLQRIFYPGSIKKGSF
ncbi:phytanoyl-CoA dioxygenase family protein, partial [Candidatus Pelagibacter sp.]|nr:phytanoyl-CoA dioxygenase family protein [Candidatus Pelagibacter sp.]